MPIPTSWPIQSNEHSATRRTVATYQSLAQDISVTKRSRTKSTATCHVSSSGCTDHHSTDALAGGDRRGVTDVRKLRGHLFGGQHKPGVVVVDRRAEHHTDHLTVEVDQRATRIALFHIGSHGVDLAIDGRLPVDVGPVEFDEFPDPGRRRHDPATTGVAH